MVTMMMGVGGVLSIKGTVLVAVLAVGGFGTALAFLPGSPVWRGFNPPKTIVVAEEQPEPAIGAEAGAGTGDPAGGIEEPRTLEIITLLGRDAIPAILEDRVAFVTGAEAAAQMAPADRVIGVSVGDDHRAYSTSQLSSHEVVNDTIGGIPVAVTW